VGLDFLIARKKLWIRLRWEQADKGGSRFAISSGTGIAGKVVIEVDVV